MWPRQDSTYPSLRTHSFTTTFISGAKRTNIVIASIPIYVIYHKPWFQHIHHSPAIHPYTDLHITFPDSIFHPFSDTQMMMDGDPSDTLALVLWFPLLQNLSPVSPSGTQSRSSAKSQFPYFLYSFFLPTLSNWNLSLPKGPASPAALSSSGSFSSHILHITEPASEIGVFLALY